MSDQFPSTISPDSLEARHDSLAHGSESASEKPLPENNQPCSSGDSARLIIFFIFAALWFFLIEWNADSALLTSPALDFLAALVALLAGKRFGGAGLIDSLVVIMLSRRMHLATMAGFETWKPLLGFVWILWLSAWATAKDHRTRTLLIAFHAGLTFDAGSSRSLGMGMNPGWEAAPLNALFLSWTWKTLMLRQGIPGKSHGWKPFCGCVPDFSGTGILCLAAIGIVWMFLLHHQGPTGRMTCQWVMTMASALLFIHSALPRGLDEQGSCEALLLGGIPILVAAIGTGLADVGAVTGGNDLFSLQKRFFAGGIHPNILGLSGTLYLLMLVSGTRFLRWKAPWGGVLRAFCLLFSAAILIASGSRTSLLILFFIGGTALLRKAFAPEKRLKAAIIGGAIAVPGLCAWFSRASLLSEWTNNERLMIWKSAWERILDHPWVGHGILSFGFLRQSTDVVTNLWVFDWNYPHVHQGLLEGALSGGIVVLVLGILVLLQWVRAWSWDVPSGIIGISLLGAGSLDFPFFSPSLVFLGLLTFFGRKGVQDDREERENCPIKEAGGVFALIVTVGMGIALVGQIPSELSLRRFDEALAALNAGKPEWRTAIDVSISLAPDRHQVRFQRLLWLLSTEARPTQRDKDEARSLERMLPDYYLPPFLVGRLDMCTGDYASSVTHLARSVELEPRDMTGIRWGNLAVAQFRAGLSWEHAARNAMSRGEWGAAMILDHPGLASAVVVPKQGYGEKMLSWDVLYQVNVARAFVERGFASVAVPARAVVASFLPDLVFDHVSALEARRNQLISATASSADSSVSGFDARRPETMGPVCLNECERQAEIAGDDDLLERACDFSDARWVRRGKSSDDLDGMFRRAGLELRRGKPEPALQILERLQEVDGGNPWILERLGIAFQASGRHEEAREAFIAALRSIPAARLRPVFSNGPRHEAQGPTGDQWTFAFELALRRFDAESRWYHVEAWKKQEAGLKRKLQGIEGKSYK
ncbi:MAG: O-antigen ligase family protein [Candidatus Ozemobacteraceae bacterium]